MKAIIRILLFSLAVLLLTNSCSLKQRKTQDNRTFQGEIVYKAWQVEEPCSFVGGKGALLKYLLKHINYQIDENSCIQSFVILNFIVAKDGTIHRIKVLRELPSALDKEAIRVVKTMPKWKPAKIKGKAVHQEFTLPVHMCLR